MEYWADTIAYGFVVLIIAAPVLLGVFGLMELGDFLDSSVIVLVAKAIMLPVVIALMFGMG